MGRSDDFRTLRRPARSQLTAATLLAAALVMPGDGATAAPPLSVRDVAVPASAFPVAVFGSDDRIDTPPAYQSVTDKVGVILDLGQKTVCTAFCVAPASVATAAHCLFPHGERSRTRLANIRFRKSLAGAAGEARVEGAREGATDLNVATGSRTLSLRPPIDADADWALIRLDRPVCPAGGLPLSRRSTEEIVTLAREGRLYNIAFHRDFGNFSPALGAPCDVSRSFPRASWETIARDFRAPEDIVLHTCDTGGSSSGSPILVDGRDGPEVVAINVGTYLQSDVVSSVRERTSARAASTSTRAIANTAIAAHAIADTAAAFTTDGLLSSRRAIRDLKKRLMRHRAYHGPIDGRSDSRLRDAISSFEQRIGRPVTGLPTERLRRHLEAYPVR